MSSKQRQPSRAQQSRRAARELAVQGLYQWHMTRKPVSVVEAEFRAQLADEDLEDHENWLKVMELADMALFHELLTGAVNQQKVIDSHLAPVLDRALDELDTIELSILRLGVYELGFRPEVPYRAAINESVELAKAFGATEGHRYVNSILDKLAAKLRSAEVEARRR